MSEINVTITRHEDCYIVENSGVYYKVGMREGQILERMVNGESVEEILQKEKLTKEQLTELMSGFQNAGVIGKQKKKKNNILFYRIPLIQADKLFGNVVEVIKKHMLLVKLLLILSVIIDIFGCVFAGIHFGEIFTLSSLKLEPAEYVIIYATFLISVCFHEFAHGVVCKYYGGKVGTLGFMLIFFSPAMYCDISGVRVIESKYKKIMASFAGIYVNLFFMSIASLGFVIFREPILAAFIIMSFTTILSNLIPFVRLDGYWILSFATGITNLYTKSLKGVKKLLMKCSLQERFIAVYGVFTYGFIIMALGSLGISAIQVIHYAINIFI